MTAVPMDVGTAATKGWYTMQPNYTSENDRRMAELVRELDDAKKAMKRLDDYIFWTSLIGAMLGALLILAAR